MVRKNEHMFDITNLTPLAMKALLHLARAPDNEYYLRELAKEIDASVGGLHEVLKHLHQMHLINKRPSGKNLYFSVRDGPAIHPFKLFMNIMELEPVVGAIKEQAATIILYGSCASGEDVLESDIDLLIVTQDTSNARSIIKGITLSRELRPLIISSSGLMKLKTKDPAFYDEVMKGVVLWRNEEDV
jgi:predicted nucleotidyltransferase